MAAKTTKPVTDSVDAKFAENPYCADNCGAQTSSPRSTFLQGHDQRLISALAELTTYGELTTYWIARLELSEGVNDADIQNRINEVSEAVQAKFSGGLASKYVSAAHNRWAKEIRKEDLADRRTKSKTKKAEAEAAAANREANKPAPKPTPTGKRAARKQVAGLKKAQAVAPVEAAPASTVGQETADTAGKHLRGAAIRVKVGRWTYDGVVIGMNQTGKVTAVEILDKNGKEKVVERFTIVD